MSYHQPTRSTETTPWTRNGNVETREVRRGHFNEDREYVLNVTVETRPYVEPVVVIPAPVAVPVPTIKTVEMEIAERGQFKAEYHSLGYKKSREDLKRVHFSLSPEDMEAYDMYAIMSSLTRDDKVLLVGEGRDWVLAPGECQRLLSR